MNTKTSLLNAAENLVRTRGYDAFSFADLSREVGIRKASIHHYFPTKTDLAQELISRYCDGVDGALQDIERTHRDAGGQLCTYLDIYRTALGAGDQLCLCVAFAGGRNSYDVRVLERLNRFHADSINWLNRLFARAAEDGTISRVNKPRAEAHATLALVEGAQLIARAAADVALFDQSMAGLLARIAPSAKPN